MNPTSHYEASLQRDIDRIRQQVIDMGGLAEGALRRSIRALVERDRQAAYSVILRDQYIDEAEKELDRLCLEFLVRQQPVARHLRFVYAALKINNELERIGDYAESVARQVLKISSLEFQPPYQKFSQIADLSIAMLHNTIRAFVEQNADLARETMQDEEKADDVRNDINHDLMQMRQEGKLPLEALTPLMTIARRFERVADQAKNICEEVVYMCTGQYMKHLGTQTIRVLFVDERNSCRSQMAEGIGNSLGEKNFVFSSAGLNPQPIDPRTIQFLSEHGIDISRHTSNSLEHIPHLDQHQVIVALTKEARKAFPPPPTKVVGIEWDVKDPSRVQGSEQEVKAAYEATFQYLNSHIRDLVQAFLGENENGGKTNATNAK